MRLGATVTGRMETDAVPIIEIPASALTQVQPAAGRLGRRSGKPHRVDAQRRCAALRSGPRRGLAAGSTPARSSSRPACRRCIPVRRSGCSDRSHERFQSFGMGAQATARSSSILMIVAVVAGVLSYFRLGRSEDPDLHHQDHGRAGRLARRDGRRHAQAGHRAARAQAAGNAEARFPAQLHARRRHHDLRQSEGQHDRAGGRRTSGTTSARASATSATPCRPASSGRASTTISATRSASSTASRPTASRIASCATMSRTSARSCCRSPTSRRSRSSARRTSGSSSSSR